MSACCAHHSPTRRLLRHPETPGSGADHDEAERAQETKLEKMSGATRLSEFVSRCTGGGAVSLAPLAGDASFRRYWRVNVDGRRYVLMDAPPDHEDVRPFLHIAGLLAEAGIHVPAVHCADVAAGLVLLEDLGDRLYLEALGEDNADELYGLALETLARIASAPPWTLAPYDRARLIEEMALFPEWFLERHLGVVLDEAQRAILERSFEALVGIALAQPQVFVHRDYHSRNLLITDREPPGVVDFQDAVHGPVTYDAVSLLKDSYIAWPRERQLHWLERYREMLVDRGVLRGTTEGQFVRWFDLMGVQRQLKVCGIFARLWHRDGKAGYLRDIPQTYRYLMAAAGRYPETRELHDLLCALDLEPRMEDAGTNP